MESKAKRLMDLMKNEAGGPGGGAKGGMGAQGSVASLGKIPMGFLTKRRKKRLGKGK
jgi:hypothetical protein